MICTSPIKIPSKPDLKFRCRKCLSCQITKRQEWAMRCVFESYEYSKNSFLTLTFDDQYIPPDGVIIRDLQLFMKRLRKKISPIKVKYVACGEYGEKFSRPHYHLLLFGYDFPDKKYFKKTKKGENIYVSDELSRLWPYGISSIGAVNHSTSSYVAGYVHKKVNGKESHSHYVDYLGQIKNKEFIVCSKGIARKYFDDNKLQLFNHDYIIYNGKKFPLFEYYNRLLTNDDKLDYNILLERRSEYKKTLTREEAVARDYILKQKFSNKNRSLE